MLLLHGKLYYKNKLQKNGKIQLYNNVLVYIRDNNSFRALSLDNLNINEKTNTIRMFGSWKGVFSNSDLNRIKQVIEKEGIKMRRPSKRRSVKRSIKRRSVKRSIKRRSVKRSIKKRSVKRSIKKG